MLPHGQIVDFLSRFRERAIIFMARKRRVPLMNIKLPALSVVADLHGHADDSSVEGELIFNNALSG